MKLYCHACNELHQFTPGDVERIVYALDAMQADARTDNEMRVDGDGYEALECYEVALSMAHSIEGYYEHTTACVERRRALERTAVSA